MIHESACRGRIVGLSLIGAYARGVAALSVVLPNYNDACYLPRALDALLGQTRPADEVIVVDDGSTDGSLVVLDDYARRHASIAILRHQENLGVVAALNTGIAKATGQYIYMAAADDVVMPWFFERAIHRMQSNPGLGLFTGTTLLRDGTTGYRLGARPVVWPRYRPGAVTPQRVAQLLQRSDNWILTGASMLHRGAIEEAGGLDPELGSFADGFLVRKIALKRGFYFDSKSVSVWNVRKDSVSRRTATSPPEAVRALTLYVAKIRGDPAFPAGYWKLFGRRWRFAVARIALELPAEQRGVIPALAAEHWLDRLLLMRLAPRLPNRLSMSLSLGWLYLRLRPTTLVGVVASGLVSRLSSWRLR